MAAEPAASAPASPPPGDRWGTSVGVILAVAGSAVGLGNFLRFPGQALEHGGGAFMIPYLCALLLLGIPLCWAEWTMGRYGGERGLHSVPGILGIVGRGRAARYLGVVGLLIPLAVYMYYGLIEAWCLQYAWAYASGGLELGGLPGERVAASRAFFEQVSGAGAHGAVLADGARVPVYCWLLVFALNLWLIHRGLSRGIEAFCRWAMPAMALCAVVVLVRVLTLGAPDPAHPERDVLAGLGFLWNPDFSRLGDFDTWMAAAGQVFFSLSVGFGVILNYASYLRRQDDVVLGALTASATNEVFEVSFGGMITVTAAFVFLGASGALGGSFGLGFHTLPVVFVEMGAWGRWVGALWFFMLFLAAITSSLSMLQPVKAFFEEALGLRPGAATLWVAALAGTGGLWVIYFSHDLAALETLDFWVGTLAIFLLATVEILCFGWILGVDRGLEEAHRGAQIQIPRIYRFVLRYVAPVYLLAVAVGFCVQNLPVHLAALRGDAVAMATLLGVVSLTALLACLTWRGERRWRALGIDLDGAGAGVPSART